MRVRIITHRLADKLVTERDASAITDQDLDWIGNILSNHDRYATEEEMVEAISQVKGVSSRSARKISSEWTEGNGMVAAGDEIENWVSTHLIEAGAKLSREKTAMAEVTVQKKNVIIRAECSYENDSVAYVQEALQQAWQDIDTVASVVTDMLESAGLGYVRADEHVKFENGKAIVYEDILTDDDIPVDIGHEVKKIKAGTRNAREGAIRGALRAALGHMHLAESELIVVMNSKIAADTREIGRVRSLLSDATTKLSRLFS